MKASYVLTLSDGFATLETVGGKGASLARMSKAGLPVPGGFHITTDAYRQFVAAKGLHPLILTALKDVDPSLPASLEIASATIGGFFAVSIIPPDVELAIRDAYSTLQSSTADSGQFSEMSVTVRSSATASPWAVKAKWPTFMLPLSAIDRGRAASPPCCESLE